MSDYGTEEQRNSCCSSVQRLTHLLVNAIRFADKMHEVMGQSSLAALVWTLCSMASQAKRSGSACVTSPQQVSTGQADLPRRPLHRAGHCELTALQLHWVMRHPSSPRFMRCLVRWGCRWAGPEVVRASCSRRRAASPACCDGLRALCCPCCASAAGTSSCRQGNTH